MKDYSDKAVCEMAGPPILFYKDFCGPCGYRRRQSLPITSTYNAEVYVCAAFDKRLERSDDRLAGLCDTKRCDMCTIWEESLDETQSIDCEIGDFGEILGR